MSSLGRKPFSIGYVTQVTGVNRSTLRAWETHGLVGPAKGESGYRTFDADDIERVRQIAMLRRTQALSLTAIGERLRQNPPSGTSQTQLASVSSAPQTSSRERADKHAAAARTEKDALLGQLVRALRTEAGMSLRRLADEAGLTPSHLSMFERGVAFPSPSRLAAIAKVFNRSLAEMLGGTQKRGSPITRHGAGRIVSVFGPQVSVEQLTVNEELMDCEIWSLKPGAASEGSYSHEGQELIFVLEGLFELALDGEEFSVLGAGDSAYFDSTRLHRWRNASSEKTVVLWINSESGRAVVARHGTNQILPLGSKLGEELGGQIRGLELPKSARTFRVIDTHTAGHPTRILLDGLPGLDGDSVCEKRERFKARYDHLRSLLLHEPRGHAATFGLVPVRSTVADFGAIFVSSYSYLDMCGHGTIGFARALAALGRLPASGAFTLETPAGIVGVTTRNVQGGLEVSFRNVDSVLEQLAIEVAGPHGRITVDIAYGGCRYALVNAADAGLILSKDSVGQALSMGGHIKSAVNAVLAAQDPDQHKVESVLFFEDMAPNRWRQLVVLESNKFDRSPCGTGTSARMAERVGRGLLSAGDEVTVESILGLSFRGLVAEVHPSKVSQYQAVSPVISGTAHLSALSTLIVEDDEPLPAGFLCR